MMKILSEGQSLNPARILPSPQLSPSSSRTSLYSTSSLFWGTAASSISTRRRMFISGTSFPFLEVVFQCPLPQLIYRCLSEYRLAFPLRWHPSLHLVLRDTPVPSRVVHPQARSV